MPFLLFPYFNNNLVTKNISLLMYKIIYASLILLLYHLLILIELLLLFIYLVVVIIIIAGFRISYNIRPPFSSTSSKVRGLIISLIFDSFN